MNKIQILHLQEKAEETPYAQLPLDLLKQIIGPTVPASLDVFKEIIIRELKYGDLNNLDRIKEFVINQCAVQEVLSIIEQYETAKDANTHSFENDSPERT
jgi:hypothetical protein